MKRGRMAASAMCTITDDGSKNANSADVHEKNEDYKCWETFYVRTVSTFPGRSSSLPLRPWKGRSHAMHIVSHQAERKEVWDDGVERTFCSHLNGRRSTSTSNCKEEYGGGALLPLSLQSQERRLEEGHIVKGSL